MTEQKEENKVSKHSHDGVEHEHKAGGPHIHDGVMDAEAVKARKARDAKAAKATSK